MGEGFLSWYRTKVKQEYKTAFWTTFLITLLIHLYKFTNTLPNHDGVYNYYADQNILGSGRWALSLACGISSYYDLPWVNGLLSCLFMALTAVVIVAVFGMKNPVVIGLTGAILAASPATAETLFFLYTADGYMLAMLFAALGVYWSRIAEKRWYLWVLSGVLICIACGIYQAYVSFGLMLAVGYFIDVLLKQKHEKADCLKWVLRQAIIYVAALAAYYVIWKLMLKITGTEANNYQGISEVGKISVGLLVGGLKNAIRTFVLYFTQWNVFRYGFTLYSVLNILFLGVFAVGVVLSVWKSGVFRRKWALGLIVLCLIALIPFAGIWHFVSDSVVYRPLMLQSISLLFILTVVLFEEWSCHIGKNAVCLFLILITANNALMTNISYYYMHQAYERSYAEALEMMIRIHEVEEEYDPDNMAILGTRWGEMYFETTDPVTGGMPQEGKTYILTSNLESTILLDPEHVIRFMQNTFGLQGQLLDRDKRIDLYETEAVQEMGCWPENDCIAVIDGILVLKLSDINEVR